MTFKNDNLPLLYIGITEKLGKYQFQVNDEIYDERFNLANRLNSIIQYATYASQSPMLAKIELLDKNGYYDLALNLPIVPAVFDITNKKEMEQFIEIGCGELVERGLMNSERVQKLVALNTDAYMNYICHEFALRYIYAKKDGNNVLANKIEELSFMKNFDLSKFSNTKVGHYPFYIPQLLNFPQTSEGKDYVRTFYMGLQECIPEWQKTKDYYIERTKKDFDYGALDNNLNKLLETYQKDFAHIDYIPAIASSNTSVDLNEKQKGQN